MADVLKEVGEEIKTVAEDVAHVVVEAVEFPVKATKVIDTLSADQPELKAALATLVADGEAVSADVLQVVSADGTNIVLDLATWTAVTKLVSDGKAAVALIEQLYAQLNSDVA
jgi:hypothetical protein